MARSELLMEYLPLSAESSVGRQASRPMVDHSGSSGKLFRLNPSQYRGPGWVGYTVNAGAAVAVWLLETGESVGKRADGTYVGLSELLPEEEVGKYVGAPVGTAGASGNGAPVGATALVGAETKGGGSRGCGGGGGREIVHLKLILTCY